MKNNKQILSVVSLLAGVGCGFTAMFIPPQGIIDSSILLFTAQLLVYSGSALGIDVALAKFIDGQHELKNNDGKKL